MLAAAHDGHTLILGSPMELVLAPLAMSSVKHKPEDVKVVARVGTTHMVLLTRKDLPVNNIDELIALIKKPGAKSLSYGSVGPGSLYHLLGEKFALHTGTALLHIPYKGAAPLLTDLMGGQIDMVFMPLAGGTPGMIADGKVKAIGITSRTPHPRFPHLTPMAAQKSMAGFEYDLWVGLQVPAATPAEATLKLNKAIYEVLQNPSVRNNLESSGSLIGQPMDVAELARMYSAEIARYQAIAKSIQLQPQ